MGKTSNPVDAHRKALRAKELKKNKQNKAKAKEITTVKKDTRREYEHDCTHAPVIMS